MDIEQIKKNKSVKELLEFSLININKPSGPTSFKVSEFVKRQLDLRKTSHMGTLDPKVTGVLPVTLNRACKLSGYFIGHDKFYVGIMRLHEEIVEEELIEKIKKFVGKIMQLPPVKSRVKREIREREVKKFEVLEIDGKDVLFFVECQAGTYIRKLIHDLGEEIGGAHMLELRRTQACIFNEDNLYDLYEFVEAVEEYKKGNEEKLREMLIPAEIISEIYEVVQVKENSIDNLLTGKPIFENDLVEQKNFETDDIVCVFSEDRFIGMYKVVNEGEVLMKTEFVLQEIKD